MKKRDNDGLQVPVTQGQAVENSQRQAYESPKVLEVFDLEALAVLCTDANSKHDVGLGCSPGVLYS